MSSKLTRFYLDLQNFVKCCENYITLNVNQLTIVFPVF